MKPLIRYLLPLLALGAATCSNEYPFSENSTTQTSSNQQQTTQTVSPAAGDSLVWSGETMLATNQTIAAGVTYWCAPGTQLTLPAKGTLTVKGTLIIAGTSDLPVRIFSPSGSTILVSGKLQAEYLASDGYGGSLLTGSGGTCVLSNVQISGYAKALDGVFDSVSVRNGTFAGNAAAISLESISGVTASGAALGDMELSGIQITGSGTQAGTGISLNGNIAARATVMLQQALFNNLNDALSYSVPVAGAKLTAVNITIHNCNDGIVPITSTSGAFDTIIVSDADMQTQDTVLSLDSAQGANQLIIQNANAASQTVTPIKIDHGASTSLQFNAVTLVDKSGFPYTAAQVYKNVADSVKFKVLALDSTLQTGLGAGYAYVAITQPLTNEQPSTLALPDVPVITGTTSADGSVTVSWNLAGGATSYNIYYEAGSLKNLDNAAAKIIGVSSPKTIVGLADGQPYTFAVSAVNDIGESNVSAVVVASPLSLPGAPLIDSIKAADSSVTVTWNPVALASSYTLYYAAGNTVDKTAAKFSLTADSKTVKGLTDGTPYAFAVSATNSIGEGPLSAVVTATPSGPLVAPVITNAIASDGSVTLSWNPVNGASSYNLYYAAGRTVDKTGSKISGVASPKAVTGLADGVKYAFAVSAVSGAVESALSLADTSTPQAAATQPSAPAVPTGIAAVAGSGSVQVTWNTAPGVTYTLYYAPGPHVDTTGASFANATSGKTVLGLTNGELYAFGVCAVNTTGKSGLDTVTATPFAAPSAPVIVSVSPGDSSDTVSWGAVALASSYNLYYNLGSSVDTTGTKLASVTSPTIVRALSDGQTYAFAVQAVNSGGKSPLSKADTSTPGTQALPAKPSAPVGVTADTGAGQVTISWSAVSGATSYNLYYKSGASVTKTTATTEVSVQATSKVVAGLSSETTFGVTAVNAGGESALSATVTVATP